MFISLTKKIEKCGTLQFVLLFTVLSEMLTAFMNALLSRIFWGKISLDLLAIGSVDALIVSLVVSSIGIYLIRKNANLMAINRQLLDDGISWGGIWRATVTNKKTKTTIT